MMWEGMRNRRRKFEGQCWDGPKSLYEMLDFADRPKRLQEMTQDYRINLIDIRKLEDTSVFRTDVWQVFDFIRCSEDENALKELMERDAYYQNMEEDAFDVIVQYANATELAGLKEYYRKDGVPDADILALAECYQRLIDKVRSGLDRK